MKRGEEKKKRKKKKEKRILGMDYYRFVWICELLYGFLDSWILGLVLCLGFAMRSSNPPLHVFVEVVGLELVGICMISLEMRISMDLWGFM